MSDYKKYYKSQLETLGKYSNPDEIPTIVISLDGTGTKCLNLNKDSLEALLEWCEENDIIEWFELSK